jgi:hypothetical protein
MSRALGFGLDLQRIITGGANAFVGVDALKEPCVRKGSEAAARAMRSAV